MATLTLTPEEFADIALLFLADKAVNPEKVVPGNEPFHEFMKRNAPLVKGKLLKYYLDADPLRRRDYKFIKKVFADPKAGLQTIRIGEKGVVKMVRKEKSKAKSLIKKLIKKVLKKEELEQDEILLLENFLSGEEE